MSNLSEIQKAGVYLLIRRRDDKEIVISQTNKPSKIVPDGPSNYIDAASPHIIGDTVINEKEYEQIEKEVNAHAVFWTNILQAAKNTGDQDRFKESTKSHNSAITPSR